MKRILTSALELALVFAIACSDKDSTTDGNKAGTDDKGTKSDVGGASVGGAAASGGQQNAGSESTGDSPGVAGASTTGVAGAGASSAAAVAGAAATQAPSGLPSSVGATIHAYAGGGLGDGGLATAADLSAPTGITRDAQGNLYIADTNHNSIRKVDAVTGKISTLAGGNSVAGYSGDGAAAATASLNKPYGLAFDASGNLYIADTGNSRIRRIDRATGLISTVAGNGTAGFSGDGTDATTASINLPTGIAIHNGSLYIADITNHRLRKVDLATNLITTVAGTGTAGFAGDGGLATEAQLKSPRDIDIDATGNIFFSDGGNNRIRRIDTAGIITTVAGSGTAGTYSGEGGDAKGAVFTGPYQPIVAPNGDLFVLLRTDSRIVKVDHTTNVISTVVGRSTATGLAITGFSGDGDQSALAKIYRPVHGFIGADGNLLFTDGGNNRVRKIDVTGAISTIAGTSFGFAGENVPPDAAEFKSPTSVTSDAKGNLYVADTGNHRVRKVDATTELVTTIAGVGEVGFSGDSGPATSAKLDSPTAVVVDSSQAIYIADSGNNRVRRIDPTSGIISTYAGSEGSGFAGDGGSAELAQLLTPTDLGLDAQGNLYIADLGNHRIRRVDHRSSVISTVAGNGLAGFPGAGDGGPAVLASLKNPTSLAVSSWGLLFVADTGHHSIRAVDLALGTITTVAGNGVAGYAGDGAAAAAASLNRPHGLVVDAAGQIFVADTENHAVRRIDYYDSRKIFTVAGSGTEGYAGDGGIATQANLRTPTGVWLGAAGLYVVDQGNHRIRLLRRN